MDEVGKGKEGSLTAFDFHFFLKNRQFYLGLKICIYQE